MKLNKNKLRIETKIAWFNSGSHIKDKGKKSNPITLVKRKELKENSIKWLMSMNQSTGNKLKILKKKFPFSSKMQCLPNNLWENKTSNLDIKSTRETRISKIWETNLLIWKPFLTKKKINLQENSIKCHKHTNTKNNKWTPS